MYKPYNPTLPSVISDQEKKKKNRNPFTLLFKNGKSSSSSTSSSTEPEGIFGIPLSRSSKNGSVLWDLKLPDVVSICFKEICNRGLATEGLFRLSGATSEVTLLEQNLNMCSSTERKNMDLARYDIHTLTSLVKKYLRELPESVIPHSYHHEFLDIDYTNVEELITILVKLPFYNRQLLHAILLLTGKMQDRVERNMMSPEALSTVIAPVCTGFEQTFKDIQLSVKPKSRSSLSKFDIQKHVAVNKQWMDIWKIMIEERVVLIHALNQKHLQYGDEEGPSMWYISPAYQHYLEHSNCKTLPAKQGGERRYPAPQDDELIYQTAPPMTGNENTIPIIHPNNPETRQKKHSTGFRPPSLPKSIFRKTNTLRRMLSSSALR